MDAELAAMAAAADVLPVPRVIDRADAGEDRSVLLERLPGLPAAVLALQRPELARTVGLACGAVHGLLAAVPAPAGLRSAPGASGDGARLLHLDLHPLNLLVSDDGSLTGVLDWANAASGDPVLDRARSWSIMTLDPAAVARQARPGWLALAEGWAESGGLRDIPAARALACRFMLSDLAGRYSPGELRHVSEALNDALGEAGAAPLP
jgi:Phosphotransferase enzyme family